MGYTVFTLGHNTNLIKRGNHFELNKTNYIHTHTTAQCLAQKGDASYSRRHYKCECFQGKLKLVFENLK